MKTGWAYQVSLNELVASCQRGDWQGLRGARLDLSGARLTLREILTFADQAPTLADVELRARLATLATTVPVRGPAVNTTTGNPDGVALERLLNLARERGFTFTPAGEQGSLWGERVTSEWQVSIVLGSSGPCNTARAQKSLPVPGGSLVTDRVSGSPQGEGRAR